MINKRGVSKLLIAGIIIIAVFLIGWALVANGVFSTVSTTINTKVQGFEGVLGKSFSWMNYVFGGIPSWLVSQTGQTQAIVITLLVWLMVFVTFGDILSRFSTFSPAVSWIVAGAVSIIAANVKLIVVLIGVFIGAFAVFGSAAVIAGMVAAFVAFFAVNWGIGSLGPWVMRRRAFMEAEKSATSAEAGGIELAGKIEGLKAAGEALKSKK